MIILFYAFSDRYVHPNKILKELEKESKNIKNKYNL